MTTHQQRTKDMLSAICLTHSPDGSESLAQTLQASLISPRPLSAQPIAALTRKRVTEKPGRLSIFVTHFAEEYAALFRNEGRMSCTAVSFAARVAAPTVPHVGWGTAFFDFDNDGWPDIFLVNGHVYPQIDTLDVGARHREPKPLFLNQRMERFGKSLSLQVR